MKTQSNFIKNGENLSRYIVISNIIRTFAPDDESQQGWWLVIGCSLMQIIAEQRIENGLLSVIQKILNLPYCLYIKKSCKFFQSYKKTFEMNVFLIVYLVYVAFNPASFLNPSNSRGKKKAGTLWCSCLVGVLKSTCGDYLSATILQISTTVIMAFSIAWMETYS